MWPAVDGSSARRRAGGRSDRRPGRTPRRCRRGIGRGRRSTACSSTSPRCRCRRRRTTIGLAAARALADLWDAAGIAADERRGTLGVDPVGTWVRTGGAHRPRLGPGRCSRSRRRAGRDRPARQGRRRRRHRVARRRCDRRAGDRVERRRRGAHRARPRRGRGTPRPGEPPARVPLGRDRRPVRDDRQVPRRSPACGRGSARSPASRRRTARRSTTPTARA